MVVAECAKDVCIASSVDHLGVAERAQGDACVADFGRQRHAMDRRPAESAVVFALRVDTANRGKDLGPGQSAAHVVSVVPVAHE
jgi:hypothetical protein